MTALSLAEAKITLGIDPTNTSQDTEIQQIIAEAESILQDYVGPLTQTVVTERHISYGQVGSGLVMNYPVIAVTQAVHVWTSFTLPANLLDVVGRRITRIYGNPLIPGPWDVTYTALAGGTLTQTTLPPALLRASRELTEHLWDLNKVRRVRPGGSNSETPTAAYALPYRVQETIKNFLLDGFA